MKKVLFVCLGNICRSPMAEALFKDMVKKEGLEDKIHIESRATSSYEKGNPVYYGTKDKLAEVGIGVSGMYSEPISSKDFKEFDYIIGMDYKNIENLKSMSDKKYHNKIYLLLDIDEKTKGNIVPDPWYTRDFDETYDLLLPALKKWLEKIKEEL